MLIITYKKTLVEMTKTSFDVSCKLLRAVCIGYKLCFVTIVCKHMVTGANKHILFRYLTLAAND